MKHTFSAIWSEKLAETIKQEIAAKNENFSMTLKGNDALTVVSVVNQGIDSHLEACFMPSRGDKYVQTRYALDCSISPESLPVLIRRLMESNEENALTLATDIVSYFDIELI